MIKLKQAGNNQTIVTIGTLNMYFSYEACIAFDHMHEGAWCEAFNPDYRKYSTTTSKHASQMGVKGYDDAANGIAFNLALSVALALVAANVKG